MIVEPAHPARITPLLMAAYGLTEREQAVTRLVLRGDSTAEIAERLVVSPHTVQEHFKKIFEKTNVRSRRELVGRVFLRPLRTPVSRQRASRPRRRSAPRRAVSQGARRPRLRRKASPATAPPGALGRNAGDGGVTEG